MFMPQVVYINDCDKKQNGGNRVQMHTWPTEKRDVNLETCLAITARMITSITVMQMKTFET